MRLLDMLRYGMRWVLRRSTVERELDDEIAYAVRELTERHRARGLSPAAARRAALLEMGGIDQVKEQVRGVRIGIGIETAVRDAAFAFRSLRKSRAFSITAIVNLALGIGATSAMFSVIYGVLIDPYPYAKPGEMWVPQVLALDGRGGHAPPSPKAYTLDELPRLRELPAFGDVIVAAPEPVVLTGEFAPENFNAVRVSGDAFSFLGVPPVAGRTIQPSDIRADGQAEPVVVLSHPVWLRLFDGNPSAIGHTLKLNNLPHTIVGVMPPGFGWYGGNRAFWLPLPVRQDLRLLPPVIRLAPGVTPAVAEQQLDALHKVLASEKPASFPSQGFKTALVKWLDLNTNGQFRTSLKLLLSAAAFLLLTACVNVANLQIARGTTRAREMAVRMAVGASRRRLVRQLLTENVVLALLGGAGGVAFAFAAVRGLVAVIPDFVLPDTSRIAINVPVLLFAFVVSVVTAILFGLAPALKASRTDVTDVLKSARSTGAGPEGRRTRSVLVVVEVALSVILLVGSGLTIRTYLVLRNTDVGYNPDRVLTVGLPLRPTNYATHEQRTRFTEELLERVRSIPGVEAATIGGPFGGPQSAFTIAGQVPGNSNRITVKYADADHLRVFGISLRAGRMFDASEVRRRDRVAVINEAAARLLWPTGHNPIGTRVRLDVLARPPAALFVDASGPPEVTIVGIIATTKNGGLRSEPLPALLLPYSIFTTSPRPLYVRSAGDPSLLVNSIRSHVRELDPEQPIGPPSLLNSTQGVWFELLRPRFTMAVFSTFGLLGLALAATGIYSLLSFHVTVRTYELGVRLALGAPRHQLLSLVVLMGARLVLAGLCIGIAASLGLMRFMRSELFGVQPVDPLTYATGIPLLGLVALLACYLPARRAAAVDPMVALRLE